MADIKTSWGNAESVQGKQHPDTLRMAVPAETFWNQPRWKKAEELGGQMMETNKRVSGVENPNRLTSMADLASTYMYQGRWMEAEVLGVQVMETYKSLLGVEHADTLNSIANLASIYFNHGLWGKAEALDLQVVDASKRVLGTEHPTTLDRMTNLLSTYTNQGRWKEAEELGVQVMETNKRVLGADHPATLGSISNLALTYAHQGRLKEAEVLGEQVVEASKRALGAEHPATLGSINSLALTYTNQGRWKEAEALGVQVMKTCKRLLGVEHVDTLRSTANLASTYFNQGRWGEAEALDLQVVETRKRVLGTEHPATIVSINNLASTFGIQGRWKEMEALGPQQMDTADQKLKAIEQGIRIVCDPGRTSTLLFDLPRELVDFLRHELRPDCDLSLVPTITGTATKAFAGTVKDYMNFAWPSVEFDILDLVSKARKDRGRAEIRSSQLTAWITPRSLDGGTTMWRVSARACQEELVIFAHQLCWISACFRAGSGRGISYSDVFIRVTAPSLINISLASLRPSEYTELGLGPCWHQMFQNFVIAIGFPIPNREHQKGIELPLELMRTLGRVRYPVDCLESPVLKGHSTALIPMSYTQDSVQWHFESQKTRTEPIEFETIEEICQTAVKGVDLKVLWDSSKRHFLGLWEHAEIHLGTVDSNYKVITRSGADEESHEPVIVREFPFILGSSGMGFFGVQGQFKFAWSNAVEAELRDEDQLLIDQIRQAGDSASVIYDTETKCGWLVSELSLIHELILAWAVRQNDPHRQTLLSRIPRAEADCGRGRAVSELLDMQGNRVILPNSGTQREVLLLDRFVTMFNAFQKRKDQVRLKKKDGFQLSRAMSSSSTLYGWDFDDIASQVRVSKRRQISISGSSGGWESIASQNPDILIVLCTKAGFPIRAKYETRICDYWAPLPPQNSYLVASVPTLLSLSRNLPGKATAPRLSTKNHYCCRRPSSDLFDPCQFNCADRKCNRLQQLKGQCSGDCLSFEARGAEGAVVFGGGKLSRRGPCRRFEGYGRNEGSANEAQQPIREPPHSSLSNSLYPWIPAPTYPPLVLLNSQLDIS